jgi:hypothetical protein
MRRTPMVARHSIPTGSDDVVDDADALQELRVFQGVIEGMGALVGLRAEHATFGQRLGNEEYPITRGAPEVDHHMPVTGETDFQDAVGDFSAVARQRKGTIAHVNVIARAIFG